MWNISAGATSNNRSKRSLCIEYLHPEGARLLEALLQEVDVVIHNFRLSVADKLQLTRERLHRSNPRLVVAALSSQGDEGPRRNYSSYGTTLEGLGGLASVTGYAGGEPLITGINLPDQACPLLAVGAIVSALLERATGGQGSYIDFAQIEAAASLVADPLIEYQQTGIVPARTGNTRAGMLLQAVLPCSPADRWLAVSAETPGQLQALCLTVTGSAVSYAGESLGAESITPALASWAAKRTPAEGERELLAAGVPAAAVLSGPEVFADRQLVDRGYFDRIVHPLVGEALYNGNPIRWTGS